ncbi:thiamine diphosphokinase [Aureibacillus halotolerans]|uniref:Thiamine diphosphokinase n=1 Tax=Aureibacillus halotolerans TaxID=1508390 RepID=A0A4R6U7P1_9BACI|nr:thiamine diphosphokinase [Aureibacillus halotolerans]TDQ42381.1 thiamine diphosphokinase [Aureibacillus halotolerans]
MSVWRIMAGGPMENVPIDECVKNRNYWIGVDRGAAVLQDEGIDPIAVFGDFDSPEGKAWLNSSSDAGAKHLYPEEKNDTDLALCVTWALAQKPARLEIYGATGGRLDHFIGSIGMLEGAIDSGVNVVIIDRWNELSMYTSGSYTLQNNSLYTYLSFHAVTASVEGLTLKGVKYPLQSFTLERNSTRCVSNEFSAQQAQLDFCTGRLLMIRSRDRNEKE